VRDGTWVDFAIGPIDGAAQTRILEALAAARTPAE
jgi:hypothetical protein